MSDVIPLRKWIGYTVILAIPVVNILFLIIWSMQEHINPNKRNWARASLIVYGIIFAVSILLMVLGGSE